MHREVPYPDDEDWQVDGEDPKHKDQDGMCVVVEVVIGVRSCLPSHSQRSDTSCNVDDAEDKIRKLIWNYSRD
jgi:hypothetical protein